MARLMRYVWPTLAVAWVVAFVAAGAGSSVGGGVGAWSLPAVLVPAMLLAAVALACLSIVDTAGGALTSSRVRMARRARVVAVLRSFDPDAAGRQRPRAPGA